MRDVKLSLSATICTTIPGVHSSERRCEVSKHQAGVMSLRLVTQLCGLCLSWRQDELHGTSQPCNQL
jgi:hypothetical protein